MDSRSRGFVYLLITSLVITSIPTLINVQAQTRQAPADAYLAARGQDLSQARAALEQGLGLLRRNRADQALGYLETALQLFEQANESSGRGAAQDALGDIY